MVWQRVQIRFYCEEEINIIVVVKKKKKKETEKTKVG